LIALIALIALSLRVLVRLNTQAAVGIVQTREMDERPGGLISC
jgi:hypothetical protein